MKKKCGILFLTGMLLLNLSGSQPGNPIYGDDFETKGLFIENWAPSPAKQVVSEDGAVKITGGGNTVLKRDLPVNFHASVDMVMKDTGEKGKGGFAGFFIDGMVFVIRPDGQGWMVYKVPGEKRSSGSIRKIDGFAFGKSYKLTLIRNRRGTSDSYLFLIDGKQIGTCTVAAPEKASKLSLGSYRYNVIFDNFLLSGVKDGTDSPNLIVNSSFEHTQEGMPPFYDSCTTRNYSYKRPYEEFLKTFAVDSKEKHSGKQSLRLIMNDSVGQQAFLSYDTGVVSGQPFTYSLWLKASEDHFPVTLQIWEMRTKWLKKPIVLSKEWKRYEFTVEKATRPFMRAGLHFKKAGTVWVDDIQVEIGNKATPYLISSLDSLKFVKEEKVGIPADIVVKKLSKAPVLDGNLDAWKGNATKMDRFFSKGDKTPKHKTEAYFACDADHLYIGVRAYVDDLAKVKAKKLDHDSFGIFGHDNIEMLIDPSKTGKNHYQIVMDAAGNRTELGLGRNPAWSGDWKCAVKQNPSAKSIDYTAVLPLSLFASSNLTDRWGINIGRLDIASGEVPCLTLDRSMNFHKTHLYPALVFPGELTKKHALGAETVRFSELDGGKKQIQVDFLNNSGVSRKGVLRICRVKDGKVLGEKNVAIPSGKSSVALPITDFTGNDTTVVLRFADGAKEIFYRILPVQKDAKAVLVSRLNYYMNEPEAKFRVETALASPEKLVAELRCGNVRSTAKGAKRFVMSLPLQKISDGTHEVVLTLSENGKAVASVKAPLVKRPYRKGVTQINQWMRSLVHDGKAIFPFMPLTSIWSSSTPKTNRMVIDFYHKAGFKTIMLIGNAAYSEKIRDFIAQAEEKGIKILLWTGWSPYTDYREKADNVLKTVDSPNVIAHLVIDEPELYMSSEKTRDLLVYFRSKLPYYPVFMNNTVIGIPNRFADLATDILMLDDYLTNRENRTVAEIVDQADIMWKAGKAENKPCFYFLVGNNMHNHYREPTAAEQVAQSYGSIAANCTGLTYFMGDPSYPAHWEAYKKLNQEILALGDVILSEEECSPAAVSDSRLRSITRKKDGFLTVIAVNIEKTPSTNVSYVLPSEFKYSGDAEVLFENRRIPVKNGRFTDSFEPLSRHVYKIKLK